MPTLNERVRAKTGFDTTQVSDTDLNIFAEEAKVMFEKITGIGYDSSVLVDAIISDFVSGIALNRVNGADGIKNYKLGKLSVTKFETWGGVNHFFNEAMKKIREHIGLQIKASEYEEKEVEKPSMVTEVSDNLEK